MRFEWTQSFDGDFDRLSVRDKRLFLAAVTTFNTACDAFVEHTGSYTWPARLRVKPVVNSPGIFEMTWSFAGPDGRATWEWIEVDVKKGRRKIKAPAIRWRRIGDHRVLKAP